MWTYATAINNPGVIVGYAHEQYQPPVGYVRHPDGRLTYPIRIIDETTLTGINNSNVIVGWYRFTTQALTSIRGFRIAGGNTKVIDISRGIFPRTQITGINGTGALVGVADAGDGNTDGFLLSAGTVEWLKPFAYPKGIAADGTIVGCFYPQGNTPAVPFLRGPKGNYLTLRIPGADSACANAMNNTARKIVGSYTDGPTGSKHGFIYDYVSDLGAGPALSGLPTREIAVQVVDYPGAANTEIMAINGDGVIVGTASNSDGIPYAFIGTPESN